jgi:hypothetical protein
MKFVSAARRCAVAGSFLAVLSISFPADSAIPAGYKGFPYLDSVQQIPGRIRLFRFDQGMAGKTQPEATLDANTNGVTWHDYMAIGQWACHNLRAITGPSIQVMGAGGDCMSNGWVGPDYVHDSASSDCYLADANMGDWTKYTVYVKKPGIYNLSIFQTAADISPPWGPYIEISLLNGTDSISTGTDTLHLTSGCAYDFHSWWYMKDYRQLALDSGMQLFRYQVCTNPEGNGPMNMDFVDFTYVGPVSVADRAYFSTMNGGLCLKSITPQANRTLQLNFIAVDAAPASVQCFDARGSLLFSETMNNVAMGYNHIQLKSRVTASGMVFVRMGQGKKQTQGKIFLFGK